VVVDERLPVARTGQRPFAGLLAGGGDCAGAAGLVRAHGVDDGREAPHLDQQAVAPLTGEERMAVQPALRQRGPTQRALPCALAHHLEVRGHRRRFPPAAAVLTDQKVSLPCDLHRRPAVPAIGHERIIG